MHVTTLHGASLFLTYPGFRGLWFTQLVPSASNLAKWRSFANSIQAHFSRIPTFQVDAWMYSVITYIPVIPREAEDQICGFVNAFTTHIRFKKQGDLSML